jgi:hypothetical protein
MMLPWFQGLNIPVTLATLSDAGALLSHEHQLHLADVLGKHAWQVDLSEPSFRVTGDHPLTCTAMHLLGTAAPGPGSWLWSWANPSNFAPAATELAGWLRALGDKHGIAELTMAQLPFAELPGAPKEPADAAWKLVNAAKAATGRWTAYTGHAGGGTRVAFLIEHPDFQLPPPSGPRVMRVLTEGVAGAVQISDHRLAVRGYAAARGLEATWSERSVVLSGPGQGITIEFDERDRISRIAGTVHGT